MPSGLSPAGVAVGAIMVWASIMWVAEAMPVGITGIAIPLLLIVTHAIPWVSEGDAARPPMAIAFGGTTVGKADAQLIVRDPVIADVVLPRFLAPGDKAALTLLVHNTDGAAAIIASWVRLTRAGDTFTGEISVDGKNWQQVDQIAVPMNKTVSVGLALSAHNNSVLNSTLFDNVTISTAREK